jgi:DNA-directed RNA polymerase specialized sigma24 family protein
LPETVRQSHREWILTEEAFAKFLACLDSDPARAGEKYEELREALVRFLAWRGAHFPDELVDETFNRVARKLDDGEAIRDLSAYCHGVARGVFLQWLEHPGNKRVELGELKAIMPQEPDVMDSRSGCLDHCLSQLTAENREMIIEYYQDEGREKIDHRAGMAARLGIPLNALRSRARRVRDKLERCITRCRKDRNFRST